MKRKTIFTCFVGSIFLILLSGCCFYNELGIPYVATVYPELPIDTSENSGKTLLTDNRGGWFFLNKGFRPAPDIRSCLKQAHELSGSTVLKNADVRLAVPVFVSLFPWGVQWQGTAERDVVIANQGQPGKTIGKSLIPWWEE